MATRSESFPVPDLPPHLPHITPIDFSQVKTLPESHTWSPDSLRSPEGLSPTSTVNSDERRSLPVIDLLHSNAAELVGSACKEWGAFQLKNHGIPSSLVEEVELQAKRFFALSAEHKMKALRSPSDHYSTGYGKAAISRFFPKCMWHEGFTITESPAERVQSIWPNDNNWFCDTVEVFRESMKLLAEKLTRMIFDFLEIPEDLRKWITDVSADPCSTVLQLNSYPKCPDPCRAVGLVPHTDTSLLTILHQTQAKNGLEIFKGGVGWVPVVPEPNTLVVSVGDFLHIVSNARFPSVVHRAMVNRTQQRFSVVYFYRPPMNCVVSPGLSKGRVSKSGKQVARFRSVTVKEFSAIKAKDMEKALSSIRL